MNYVTELLEQIVHLVNEMSPYLLLGFLIAGIMHAFIPDGWYARYLSGNTMRSVFNAAIFGVPLPLCSCGVIPTAMSLRREGGSKGAVVSFLIATPQTGVDSIFATYSLMGLPFAIVRPIAALFTAILGGAFVNMNTKGEIEETVSHPSRAYSEQKNLTFLQRCGEALKFGFVEMMEDIGKWLMIGLIVAGLITVLVPDSFFEVFKDNTVMSMLLVLCISIPMYLCATGSIPIAVALMMKGLTPGAALVLLMAGPACNAASILVINKVLGKKTLVLYLAAIIAGAVSFGFVIDYFLPREWFTSNLIARDACCVDETSWFSWACTGLLALLLLNVLRLRFLHKSTCSCHNHGGNCHCSDTHTESKNCTDEHCDCQNHMQPTSSAQSNANVLETRQYSVKGMNCNHCKANVEKAILSVEGVEGVEVDLHGASATVTGNSLNDTDIIKAVESIGFDIAKQ